MSERSSAPSPREGNERLGLAIRIKGAPTRGKRPQARPRETSQSKDGHDSLASALKPKAGAGSRVIPARAGLTSPRCAC